MIYLKIFLTFFWMSLISFGGVLGTLPEMHKIIVDQNHWLTADQFVQSYIVGQFVPGPNMAMCTLLGYRIAGFLGALCGFVGIYLFPTLLMIFANRLYRRHQEKVWVRRTEISLRPLVFSLILSSAAMFFLQQAEGHLIMALLIGGPFAYLNYKKRLGALSCIFLTGMIWWLYRSYLPHFL